MILLLQSAAAAAPERVAVVTPEGSSSYGALLDDARRIAAAFTAQKLTRVAIVEPDAAWVIRLLAGAALAGVEPCQYQADTDPQEFSEQATALGHGVVVTRRTDLAGALEVLRPDELNATPARAFRAVEDGPQPVMIRTTGTTGLPKAARHDWRVLSKTVESVRSAPEQRWLLAYGPHQFAGMQVLLHVLASQATLVAPFPRQPRDGLEAIARDHVTCVSATPTYWRFLLAEARSHQVELPPLQQVTLGGEASPADLLKELRTTLPSARISQVYASTEFGSVTSVKDGLPGIGLDALYSEANPTSNIRVQAGELWVRTTAGMLGYANEPDEPGGTEDGRGWRSTGDLVEIVGDRVLFRGRDSEVINVGGIKVHPLPVEERIAALESVSVARVYGRPNPVTGAIVAAEIVPAAGVAVADIEEIRRDVKKVVADLPRAWQPRSVTFVDAIKTRGGKTIRRMEP
jgi:acyl-CoA synthetase (AMP-forming)/AMP-acid ligase II